jgi:hypothetical protein
MHRSSYEKSGVFLWSQAARKPLRISRDIHPSHAMKTTYRLPCFVSTTSCIRATAVDGIDAQCAAPLDAHRRRALRRRASHRMLAATDRDALYSFHASRYIGIPLETLTCSV